MNKNIFTTAAVALSLALGLLVLPTGQSYAQEAEEIEEVVVTGSRIRRNPLDEPVAIMEIDMADIERTGLTNLGEALQQLPITGSALNSQFNVPGNSGFPQDGSGIGAGAVNLSIRNVEAKRSLVLVDGRRWIAGSSASGVPSAVDLNTIPDNVISRVEILQDGASAIYGSDAIGGVVNIITDQSFEGFRIDAQTGSYISDDDGESMQFSGLWGGGNDTTHFVVSASYKEEKGIETANRSRSAFPNPDATSCNISGTFCSSFTPQARLLFGSGFGLYRNGILDPTCTTADPDCSSANITLNDGVLNDGGANIPVFDINMPNSGDFHDFTSADRFNYNGPGFNFLKTPNERVNFYTNVTHELAPNISMFGRISYTKRTSETKAAPEPLCFFDCGNRISDATVISALNPFNPFGVDLSVANGNAAFFGRRPLESGGRLFFQETNTYMFTAGLQGDFESGGRNFYWDLTGGYGDNSGFQEKFNSHNQAKLQIALGDPAVCAQVPNCVPFNLFGGQTPPPGSGESGSITQAMLDFVRYTQRDFSEQTLKNIAFNIGGDLFDMSAGTVGFAAGFEYRDHSGSYRPDPIAAAGETAGIPAGATTGEFDVTEYYAEVNVPLIAGAALADYVEVNLAARSSDYSTSGRESTYKFSGLWRIVPEFSVRASVSTGFRAPGIGELFGGAAREDFTFTDPCADYTAIIGSVNGGRDTPQPPNIQANCAAQGVPVGLAQTNPQLSAVSAGNSTLSAEESDSWTFGAVWSPAWSEGLAWSEGITASIDFYNHEINNAVQGRDPGDVITACVETNDPFFCDSVPRTPAGQIGLVNNQLQNIGGIDAVGMDLSLTYLSPEFSIGQFNAQVNLTRLEEYKERTSNPDGSVNVNDLTGQHTDETFARAFPDLRAVTTVGWARDRWNGSLVFRWTDEMATDGGGNLDSVMFTDLRASYTPAMLDESLTVTLGFNNVFDEDPPVCFPCGVIGLSTVSHDLPGRVGYLRVSYSPQ